MGASLMIMKLPSPPVVSAWVLRLPPIKNWRTGLLRFTYQLFIFHFSGSVSQLATILATRDGWCLWVDIGFSDLYLWYIVIFHTWTAGVLVRRKGESHHIPDIPTRRALKSAP
jgi:hypothetical protein